MSLHAELEIAADKLDAGDPESLTAAGSALQAAASSFDEYAEALLAEEPADRKESSAGASLGSAAISLRNAATPTVHRKATWRILGKLHHKIQSTDLEIM